MNQLEIFDRLGLRPGGILIRHFDMADWGRTLVIYAFYSTLDEALPFRLIFRNCSEISWQSMTDASSGSVEFADVINVLFGTNQSLETCVITTDLFEVVVSYGQLTIVKDWPSEG